MNLNIVVIEDHTDAQHQLQEKLQEYEKANPAHHFQTYYFLSFEVFANDFREKHALLLQDIQLFILDIELPGKNGLEAARILRRQGYTGDLLFLTSFDKYVFDGYGVNALDYLMKPVLYPALERNLKKVCTHFNGNCYIYSKRSSSIPIPYKDILYFSSYLHCVRIITMEAVYEQYISFSSIKELLPESFCQCHRSVIVNMNHVECLNASVLTLSNNEQLTVSKPYLKQIQEAILLL